jgi:tungstate transport system substrate-binding protein
LTIKFSLFSLLIFLPFSFQSVVLAQKAKVRMALVNVPDEVLRPLLPQFEKQTGLTPEIVYTGNDPFSVGREGKADLVISHYGHEGVEKFVTEGFGLWPKQVFANQMVLLGPPEDPAHVRGLNDAAEAFRHIASNKSTFLTNNGGGAKYLEEILWESADVHELGDWYLDLQSQGRGAVEDAANKGAYVLFGLPPFLRMNRAEKVNLVPLVYRDPVFQRVMVSIIVNPKKVSGVNMTAAQAFQEFLLTPVIQARIRAFRYHDFDHQAWWPSGRNNNAGN